MSYLAIHDARRIPKPISHSIGLMGSRTAILQDVGRVGVQNYELLVAGFFGAMVFTVTGFLEAGGNG